MQRVVYRTMCRLLYNASLRRTLERGYFPNTFIYRNLNVLLITYLGPFRTLTTHTAQLRKLSCYRAHTTKKYKIYISQETFENRKSSHKRLAQMLGMEVPCRQVSQWFSRTWSLWSLGNEGSACLRRLQQREWGWDQALAPGTWSRVSTSRKRNQRPLCLAFSLGDGSSHPGA